MDWFKGKFTGKPHIQWENLWFPVDFPLNQLFCSNRHDIIAGRGTTEMVSMAACSGAWELVASLIFRDLILFFLGGGYP